MSLTDPIADMIARIKNGNMRGLKVIKMPSSVFKLKILDVLKNEGFIIDYKINDEADIKNKILINLKYNEGSPVISDIERVSKPGRRIYSSASSLPKINNGLGIAILSTPKGVMTDIDARKNKIGGEVICKVF
ncbi:MAG: 30S ribosomal protein S8 [Candidatus Pelagibacterales bacterium]|nr:MAG: 30S ribosomal protein S8 [Pelagibacterales bacterium]